MNCTCGVTLSPDTSYVAEIKVVIGPAEARARVEKLKKDPTSKTLAGIIGKSIKGVAEDQFAVVLTTTSNMMVAMPGIYFLHSKEWGTARIGKRIHVVMPDPSNRVAAKWAPVDIHDFEAKPEEES